MENVIELKKNTGELKPCKCGNSELWFCNTFGEWSIQCDACGLRFNTGSKTKEAVADLWNKKVRPTFKEVRLISGMNKTEFSKYFNIPYRTVNSWESGERKCPDYLLDLIIFKLEHK